MPERVSTRALTEGIGACKSCELYQNATHDVPGDVPQDASLMVVGEQPGDQED